MTINNLKTWSITIFIYCFFFVVVVIFITVADSESGPRPSGLSHLAAAPARILQLPPSIHFITIPDNPGCAVVQTVKLSPPVVQLPIQNTAAPHTYILGAFYSCFSLTLTKYIVLLQYH